MQARALRGAKLDAFQSERVLDHAPGVHRRAGVVVAIGEKQTDQLPLVGQLRRSSPPGTWPRLRGRLFAQGEHVADLEQPQPRMAMADVVARRSEQARQQAASERGLLGHHRVQQRHEPTRHSPAHLVAGVDDGHRPCLVSPEPGEDPLQAAPERLQVGEPAHVGRPSLRGGQLLVADPPRHLLDDVHLATHVGPERRHLDLEEASGAGRGLRRKAERSKEVPDLTGLEVDPEQGTDPLGAYGELPGHVRDAMGVDRTGRDHRRSDACRPGGAHDKLAEAPRRPFHAERVDPAFEPHRGFAAQPDAPGSPGDGQGNEVADLEQDARGLRRDLARLAAHDASDADGAILGVADQAVAGRKRVVRVGRFGPEHPGHPVEGDDLLAGPRRPDAQPMALRADRGRRDGSAGRARA